MEPEVVVIGNRLQERIDDVSADMTEVIAAHVQFLNDDSMYAMLAASVRGNVETILHILCNSIPFEHVQPNPSAIEYAYRLAQRGVPSESLRRAYHLGSENLRTRIFHEIQNLDCSPDTKLIVQHQLDGFLHRYIDWASLEVQSAHAVETQRRLEHSASTTATVVRLVLDGEPVESAEFELHTRYRINQTHLAAVIWVDRANPGVDNAPALARLGAQVARTFKTPAASLFTAVDRGTGWVWFGPTQDAVIDDEELLRVLDAVPGSRIAFGSPGAGVHGFRRSHEQSDAAKRVSLASRNPALRVARYDDPGVAITSVLVTDMPSTRTWIGEQLGHLAAQTESAQRLRETLDCFLDHDSSFTRTGKYMNLHRNTVRYRVGKAVEARERPLDDAATDLAMALQVCRILGPTAVSTPRAAD